MHFFPKAVVNDSFWKKVQAVYKHTQKQHQMKQLILYLFLFCSTFLIAQVAEPPTIAWERTFGSRADDVTYDVIQTVGGDIALVGETSGSTSDGKDGLFILLNSRGTSVVETLIGDDGDESIKKIVDLGNGSFGIAGYSQTKSGRYGWLAKIDKNGDAIWKKKYGKSNFSEFIDMELTDKKTFILAGTTQKEGNEDIWLTEIDQDGNQLWAKTYGDKAPEKCRGLAISKDGGYAITGVTNSKGSGKSDFWLIKTDNKGEIEWDDAYGFKRWEEPLDIVSTDDGGFIIAGFNSNEKRNIWVLRTNAKGQMRWQKDFGGGDWDEAHTLSTTYDGNFVIGGMTRSHRPGARYTKAWFMQIDGNGNPLIADGFYGGKWNDDIQGICQTSDGNFVIVGSTASSGMGGTDFWAAKLENAQKIEELKPSNIEVIFLGLEDGNKNNVLNANENGFLALEVKNKGEHDSYHLEGIFKLKEQIKGLLIPDKVSLGFLKAGSSRQVAIPIEATEKVPTEKVNLNVTFSDGNKSAIQPWNYTLELEETPKTVIKITGHDAPIVTVGEKSVLKVNLKNFGKKKGEGYRINFSGPSTLIALSSNGLTLPNLGYQDDIDAIFNFEVDENYGFSAIPITCILKTPEGRSYEHTIKVEVKQKETVSTDKTKPTIVRWFYPDIDFYREKPLKLRNERLFVKLKIESPQRFKRADLEMVINGKPYRAGSKLDEGSLIPTGKNIFNYQDTLSFEEDGNYKIALRSKKDGSIISEELNIVYSSAKPNLYVLSVGTKTNLEYTMQDAKDFAALYTGQAGDDKLFNDIEMTTLFGEEAIASSILGAVEDLEIKYNTDVLTENDMIIIFMSSHGFMIRDEFYIQGDDYQTGKHRTKAVRYSDMTEILDAIPCKKLIFIDACHSGGAKGVSSFAINKAIKQLTEQKAGITTIVSSAADELSYEDKEWKNGAFTEAIIEGLQGEGDKDENSIVTIEELFDFIKTKVPTIVKDIKGQPQNPQMVSTGLNNVPIYILK